MFRKIILTICCGLGLPLFAGVIQPKAVVTAEANLYSKLAGKGDIVEVLAPGETVEVFGQKSFKGQEMLLIKDSGNSVGWVVSSALSQYPVDTVRIEVSVELNDDGELKYQKQTVLLKINVDEKFLEATQAHPKTTIVVDSTKVVSDDGSMIETSRTICSSRRFLCRMGFPDGTNYSDSLGVEVYKEVREKKTFEIKGQWHKITYKEEKEE
jgi:hypothetical protein